MLGEKEYYLLNRDEVLELFNSSIEKGLHNREVRKRQIQYGLNKLNSKNSKNIFTIFFNQFKDFMILVLMIATVLSFVMGEFGDGITIFAIIILNGILGFIQEYRAEKSLAALKKLAAPLAMVIRGGVIDEIDAEELVPGDILLLDTGDRVPADIRILSSENMQADESLLTGESVPVSKTEKELYARGLAVNDQINMLFMGTQITRGRAQGIVVSTGMKTEMGIIANLLDAQERELTPLQKRLKHLGKWLVIISLVITFSIVLIGVLKGQSIYHMFLAGVSLAVAAIPEGLPAIVTLALALGVQKMIKNNAIVRRLQAVETLGCATVICSDKTGTLTKNQMTLRKVYFSHRLAEYNSSSPDQAIKKLLEIGAICSSVKTKEEEKRGTFNKVREFFVGSKLPEFIGDPTEIAMVRAIYDYEDTLSDLKNQYPVLAEETFDSVRKRMSVVIKTPDNKQQLWIKGAPEVIINRSTLIEINGKTVALNDRIKNEVIRAGEIMAGEALRVLAIAYRPLSGRVSKDRVKKYEEKLTMVGLVGMIDPPREEAFDAVIKCFKAGIRPVMITGDHRITAQVIAEDLGIIKKGGRVITGEELKKMSDSNFNSVANKVNVFARISPEDKLKIVRVLKNNGEVVAMTGDGVNDAPAVKEADIGVAMGEKGTDVTKEVSSLILADDNFATIVAAIQEGRKIYNNIRKFIRYLLSCNTGELLAIFIGIVMGLPLPLLPIQILWVNLVTDGLPALALGMDDDSDDVMEKPPRDPDESIFAHGMISNIVSQGSLIGISTMAAFMIAIYRLGTDINTARTMAFSTLVFSQLFFVFSCRSEDHSFWELSPFNNIYLVAAVLLSTTMQIGVIYLPFFSRFFQTVVLDRLEWIIVIILSTWSTILLDFLRYLVSKSWRG